MLTFAGPKTCIAILPTSKEISPNPLVNRIKFLLLLELCRSGTSGYALVFRSVDIILTQTVQTATFFQAFLSQQSPNIPFGKANTSETPLKLVKNA